MKSKPFLTFYNQIGRVPTETSAPKKLAKLEVSKNKLYETLGIQSKFLQCQDVLEIGPGSGENIFRLLKFSPKSLSILDGSPFILKNLRSKIAEQSNCEVNIILGDANEYSSEIKYDLIVVEGVLPFQNSPFHMLKNILNLLRVDGTIIVTTNDEFSVFSEVCRRYISKRIFKNLKNTEENVKLLLDFFQKIYHISLA
jgi:ubiquinone/menaquinone biosynthesis C-methylase UbiE